MARLSRAGGRTSTAKTRRPSSRKGRKFSKTKPRIPSTAIRSKGTSASRFGKELKEAREQQAATAEILKVIARSPSDVQPVFQAIADSAKRLIGGFSTAVYRVFNDIVDLVAFTPTNPESDGALKAAFPMHRNEVPAVALVQNGETAQIPDSEAADAQTRRLGRARGWRSVTFTPLMNQDAFIGFIVCTRRETGVLGEHHVKLLRTFADQAVIAIENARLFNETKEALERQTATADILKVIASSPTNVQPVFDAIVNCATKLFEPCSATITTLKDDKLHWNAIASRLPGFDPEGAKAIYPIPLDPDRSPSARAMLERRIIEIPDCTAPDTPEFTRKAAAAGGFRSCTFVPLMHHDTSIGTIILIHPQAGFRLSEKQRELVKTFADQAVIALGNVRLFDEVQEKTRDLQESLQQQIATGDVLKVISRSAFNLQTVLDTLVESATRLCDAQDAIIFLPSGETYRPQALHGYSTQYHKFIESNPIAIDRGSVVGRTAIEKQVVHISDVLAEPDYTRHDAQRMAGYRTALGVPLLREGNVAGVIFLTRTKPQPFTQKQIELITTFADQAVIAIENARLFNEVQAKTRDLEESLQQQTATADVLKIISRSSVDLKTVLDTLVETVARLCNADQAVMWRRRDDLYHVVAWHGLSVEAKEFVVAHPVASGRGTVSGRAALERRPVQVSDVLADPEYSYNDAQKLAGYRSLLSIPLLREDALIGIFSIHRTRVDPFTSKEIELASSFADQAVIAIENARLFEELRERQAELRVTFDNMADGVVMFDAATRLTAWNRNFQEMLDLPSAFLAERPSFVDFFRYLADRGEYPVDLEAQLSRANADPRQELRFERTRPDGRIVEVRRNAVPEGGFVMIYSDITERKRAEAAVSTARDAAEMALRDLQTAQDRLVQTEKLASLGQLTAGIAHEIKNPLNFVNNFSALSVELTDELRDVLKQETLTDKGREELDELTGLLQNNLGKVVQHGKRADSIVKNMLQHSREGTGERRSAEINRLVEESLNLAYHGARAEKAGFSITLKQDLDPEAGALDLYPQELTRALLNLISNGFYAATKRKAEVANGDFEPVLSAATRNLGKTVEIRIRDNGTGIPPEVREKMFNPFFTTKPTGEGTGLGLSMAHDIIVKQHGGSIDVETEPGAFTEFIITLPRDNDTAAGSKSE